MQRPEITGWGVTTNEKGIVIASVNRDQLVQLIEYVDYLEQSRQAAVSGSLPPAEVQLLKANYEQWKKGEIKDGAFSWHINNMLVRAEGGNDR